MTSMRYTGHTGIGEWDDHLTGFKRGLNCSLHLDPSPAPWHCGVLEIHNPGSTDAVCCSHTEHVARLTSTLNTEADSRVLHTYHEPHLSIEYCCQRWFEADS